MIGLPYDFIDSFYFTLVLAAVGFLIIWWKS